ncbi:MAG: hypothetical protein ACKO5K_14780 [Armatimonadota bacterium]
MTSPEALVSALHRAFRPDSRFDFNDLALALFRYQAKASAPWGRLLDHLGVDPDQIASWRGVPPMPVSAYKTTWIGIAKPGDCMPETGGRTFLSSGTTGNESSRNGLDATALAVYEAAAIAGWDRFPGADGLRRPVVALMPPANHVPESSLSHMAGALIDRDRGVFHAPGTDSDWIEAARSTLAACRRPVAVFGTAFAWVHFFDRDPDWRTVLPAGSVVIETGGYKGRSREVPVAELYGWFRDRLGVADAQCWSEYGMSELASQYWSRGVAGVKHAPPWLRARVLDPVRGSEVAAGGAGLLCHVDLANFGAALAVRTADLGSLQACGGLRCLGRLAGAPLRGCSLAAEHWGEDDETAG